MPFDQSLDQVDGCGSELAAVLDGFDEHPIQNDWRIDTDGDGVIDAFDTNNGLNDLLDQDGDGIPNGNDVVPNLPQEQSSQEQDYRNIEDNVGYYAQINTQMKTFLEFDSSPLSKEVVSIYNDSDLDGAFDNYDSNQYDPNQGGNLDPYKQDTDAWYDDDNNGWGS